MNEIATFQAPQLPDTLEDLTQFVLVGKAKLDAYMMKLRTVNRLSTAQEIRDQTLKEAQEVSTALIAAEQRIGDLLLAIPKASGQYAESENRPVSKNTIVKEMGYSKDEASDYQQMAKNPEIVQKVMAEAIANGEVVTKTQVMREIAEAKRQAKEENDKLRKALSESEAKRISEKNQVKEIVKEIEVIPADYDELKEKASRVDSVKSEAKFLQGEFEKMAEKWKKAEAENDQLRKKLNEPEEKMVYDTRINCYAFCSGVKAFLDKYGGVKYSKREIDLLPEREREAYMFAVRSMRKWIDDMLDEVTLEV